MVTVSAKVIISRVPPALELKVVVDKAPLAVFVPLVLLRVNTPYVPAMMVWLPKPASYWTVPPQVNPVGTGVEEVFCVLSVPAFPVAVVVLVRANVLRLNVPPEVVVRVVAEIFPAAVWVPLELPQVKVL